MILRLTVLGSLACVAALGAGCGGPDEAPGQEHAFYRALDVQPDVVVITGDDGRTRRVARRPQRIVSALPGITEMVGYLGALDRLVAVSPHCDLPDGVDVLPKVSVLPLDLESLVAHTPDLVLVDRTLHASDLRALEARVGPVLPLETNRLLRDVDDSLVLLAAVLGTDRAVERARAWRHRRLAVEARLAEHPVPSGTSVLVVGAWDPLNVLGPRSLLADLLRHTGARNVAHDLDVPSGGFAEELVLARQPAWILHVGPPPPATLNDRWAVVPAVARGRVVSLRRDDLVRGGPRLLDALTDLADVLRGDRPPSALQQEAAR